MIMFLQDFVAIHTHRFFKEKKLFKRNSVKQCLGKPINKITKITILSMVGILIRSELFGGLPYKPFLHRVLGMKFC